MGRDSPDGKRLRVGERFTCPTCGSESIVKVVRRMEGWTCVGQILACGLCRAKVGDVVEDASTSKSARRAERLKRAADVLGDEIPARPSGLFSGAGDEEAGNFCRDCRQFLRHPFVCRCLKHDKAVEPMDDCADFERAPVTESEGRQAGETPAQ